MNLINDNSSYINMDYINYNNINDENTNLINSIPYVPYNFSCNHQFCEVYALYYIKNNRRPTSTLCRTNITKISVQTDDIYNRFI
jgi:hypothetical protein